MSSQTEGTYSDVITCGSDDINDKAIKRLVALKVQQTMLLKALESEESKMKVVRGTLQNVDASSTCLQ